MKSILFILIAFIGGAILVKQETAKKMFADMKNKVMPSNTPTP
jgi:hypothetical protein